jgi:hypothetical protein
MKKNLFTTALVLTATLLASLTEAANQKSSVIPQKRSTSHSKKQNAVLNKRPLDANAVKWNCEHNKTFWLSGDFNRDPALTLYWAGKNHILPRLPTTTGAKRFQDANSGLDLVVLPFKAMLFNNHGGRTRLVDNCKTLEMVAVTDAVPEPMSLLFTNDPTTSAAQH